ADLGRRAHHHCRRVHHHQGTKPEGVSGRRGSELPSRLEPISPEFVSRSALSSCLSVVFSEDLSLFGIVLWSKP
ncbi:MULTISPECIES: hypothetical protein, partial [unclassified Mesorhizobium]|uniref:hypothetical protein n=1 Tax=unclassified Mesorhizobium TaxID=325217 RepID=UPI0019D30EED